MAFPIPFIIACQLVVMIFFGQRNLFDKIIQNRLEHFWRMPFLADRSLEFLFESPAVLDFKHRAANPPLARPLNGKFGTSRRPAQFL